MNCAEYKEVLVAYIEGFLQEPQKQALTEHLKVCLLCQKELQEVQRLQHRLLQNGQTLSRTDLEQEVMNRVIRQQSLQLKKAAEENIFLKLRRFLMKSPIAKIAVAAAIVLVCIAGLYVWTGTKSGVALADVLAKVEQAQAFMYRMKMHIKGQMQNMPAGSVDMNAQGTILISNRFGMKMDMKMVDPNTGMDMSQQMYVLPDQKIIVMLLPAMKKYMRMEFDESLLEQMKKQNNDPRMLIRQIMACKYEDLGKSVIDGVEVEGFRTTDPAYTGGGGLGQVDIKLWVDSKTWLPVSVEMEIKLGEQMQMQGTIYDFQWNIPVEAGEFTPVIPADFTAGPGDGVKMPAFTEDTAIVGLRIAAAFTGRYPKDLNMMTLMQDAQAFQNGQTPEALKFKQELEQTQSEEEKVKKLMDATMPITALGGFYMSLVQEKKDPAYYGGSVTPADADKVLLRWKVSDSEYRVIYGDLHAETITPEKLAELEAALPK